MYQHFELASYGVAMYCGAEDRADDRGTTPEPKIAAPTPKPMTAAPTPKPRTAAPMPKLTNVPTTTDDAATKESESGAEGIAVADLSRKTSAALTRHPDVAVHGTAPVNPPRDRGADARADACGADAQADDRDADA